MMVATQVKAKTTSATKFRGETLTPAMKRFINKLPPIEREGALRWAATKRYVDRLPEHPLPAGQYLVHNHVLPTRPLGNRGFRAWVQLGRDETALVKCDCDFGRCANAKVNPHYRVERTG